MSDLKPSGISSSAIKVAVDIETQIGGKSAIRLGDGTMIDGPKQQRFVRFLPGGLKADDWVINPATNEAHKVIRGLVDDVVIETDGGVAVVPWSEACETLLRVVSE